LECRPGLIRQHHENGCRDGEHEHPCTLTEPQEDAVAPRLTRRARRNSGCDRRRGGGGGGLSHRGQKAEDKEQRKQEDTKARGLPAFSVFCPLSSDLFYSKVT